MNTPTRVTDFGARTDDVIRFARALTSTETTDTSGAARELRSSPVQRLSPDPKPSASQKPRQWSNSLPHLQPISKPRSHSTATVNTSSTHGAMTAKCLQTTVTCKGLGNKRRKQSEQSMATNTRSEQLPTHCTLLQAAAMTGRKEHSSSSTRTRSS